MVPFIYLGGAAVATGFALLVRAVVAKNEPAKSSDGDLDISAIVKEEVAEAVKAIVTGKGDGDE